MSGKLGCKEFMDLWISVRNWKVGTVITISLLFCSCCCTFVREKKTPKKSSVKTLSRISKFLSVMIFVVG